MQKTALSLPLFLAVLALFGASFPEFAFAQDGESQEERAIEEVVVTATKRQADEADLPIAIEMFSGDEARNSGVNDLRRLSIISPSVNVQTGGGYTSTFIRGIGSLTVGPAIYGSVAVYVDGVFQPNQLALTANSGFFDQAESIQVLKGPQGTLYGRNATGGAILITTNTPMPDQELSGFAEANAGDFGVRRYQAGVSTGLGDAAAASIRFSIHENDGFFDNSGVGSWKDEDGYNVSAKLVFDPTDQLSLVFSASHADDEIATVTGQQVAQSDTFGAIPGTGLNNPQTLWAGTVLSFVSGGVLAAGGTQADADAAAGAAAPTVFGLASGIQFSNEFGDTADNRLSGFTNGAHPRSTNGPFPALGQYETSNFDLNVTHSFDTFDLVSISSYIESTERNELDILRADPTTLPDLTVLGFPALFNQGNLGFSQPVDNEVYSQEVYAVSTASEIEWLVGAVYFDHTAEHSITGDVFGTSTLIADNEVTVESLSVYAEGTYPITETLGLTAGLRYTDEEYTLDDSLVSPIVPNVGDLSESEDQITYNVKLTYDSGDFLLYGGVSTGFKSGSFNPTNAAAGQVAPEEITTYEVGFKSELDNGVRLNAALFYNDFKNVHLNAVSTNSGATFLQDGAEATVTGLELGVEVPLSDALDVFVNATYLDHEYDSDATIAATGEVVPIEGNDLAQTADFVASFGVNYNRTLNSSARISASLLGNYNSGFWADQLNLNGSDGDDDDSYFVANASITYTSPSERWTLGAYVNNLFDEEYYTGGLTSGNGLIQISTPARPRHAGVRLRFDF